MTVCMQTTTKRPFFAAKKMAAVCGIAALSLLSDASHAAPLRMCVFDFLGTSGDAYGMAKDYVLAMQSLNVDIELKAYTNEGAATDDFRNGQCHALLATAFRTRPFNAVAASTDTVGATTIVRDGVIDMAASYDVLRKLIQTYSSSSPQVAKFMVEGDYEVGGILPIGPAYPFVNDRRINSLDAAAGKRVAALEHDKAQAAVIRRVGALPVAADLSDFHVKFNNGLVDVINVPTLAYLPLELHKGMGKKGGVNRFPLMIVTYQMVFRRSKFPEGFGTPSRNFWLGQFDRILQLIKHGDASIPPSAWIDIRPEDARRYVAMLREERILLAKQGIYDMRGLKVIKRIRCHVNPKDAECANKLEEEWQ